MKTLHQNPSAARKCDATLAGELLRPPLSFFTSDYLAVQQADMLTKLIEGIALETIAADKGRDASLKVQTKTLIARKSQLTTPATV